MNLLYKMNQELDFIDMSDDFKFHFISTVQKFIESLQKLIVQPIADRLAQNLEIISENFQFGTRRTRILMGFVFYDLVVIVNPMGRILVLWKGFKNNLEIQYHPICNRLYCYRNEL